MPAVPNWFGRSVYVIGGSPSLIGFEFGFLRHRCAIGCNYAYRLGAEVCNVVAFGDKDFYLEQYDGLRSMANAGVPIVTNAPTIDPMPDWLTYWERVNKKLPTEPGKLGWFASTGAMAIHLAAILGATRVYLLGFDLAPVNGRNNWHDNGTTPRHADVYARHREGMKQLAQQMPATYPACKVVQLVSPGREAMGIFDSEPAERHFGADAWHALPVS